MRIPKNRERKRIVNITFEFPPDQREALERQAEKLLRQLRLNGKLDGFRYLVYAVASAVMNPDATRWITKGLYFDIADRFDATPSQVEKSIRLAIKQSWDRDGREPLDKIAGYHLVQRPTNSEFIDLAAAQIRAAN